jgi:hypothetical protein
MNGLRRKFCLGPSFPDNRTASSQGRMGRYLMDITASTFSGPRNTRGHLPPRYHCEGANLRHVLWTLLDCWIVAREIGCGRSSARRRLAASGNRLLETIRSEGRSFASHRGRRTGPRSARRGKGCPELGARVFSLAVPGRQVPPSGTQMARTLDKLTPLLSSGKNVLVHCRQGRGAAGWSRPCLLVKSGMSPGASVEAVSAARELA